jgi:molecular chaperone GrpE
MTKPGELNDEDMMGDLPIQEKKPVPETAEQSPAGFIENPDREELETKLTEAEQKLAASEDRVLRVKAESENILRRTERQVAEAHKYAVEKLLKELVPVLDSLEQSLNAVQDTDHDLVKSMRDGMALTLQMMQKALEKYGIKEINPINELFNPAFHEVMMAQENNQVAPNTILTVMQKGYQLHDRVIRPARVMIAKSNA